MLLFIFCCSVDLEKLEINENRVNADTEIQIFQHCSNVVYMSGNRQGSINVRYYEGCEIISTQTLILLPILNSKKDYGTGCLTLGLVWLVFCIQMLPTLEGE